MTVTSTPGNVVAAGDSGDVVGIGQTFTVEAVVQDFTPADKDAVIFYLIRGDSTKVVADDVPGRTRPVEIPLFQPGVIRGQRPTPIREIPSIDPKRKTKTSTLSLPVLLLL